MGRCQRWLGAGRQVKSCQPQGPHKKLPTRLDPIGNKEPHAVVLALTERVASHIARRASFHQPPVHPVEDRTQTSTFHEKTISCQQKNPLQCWTSRFPA